MVIESQGKMSPDEDSEKSVKITERLTSRRKNILRKQAHSLKPVVLIGQHGINESVIAEIDVISQCP